MAGKDMKYTISGNAKQEAQGFDALAKAADKAGVALDGTQTTAQQVASAISGLADQGKSELEGIASAADALRQHLGDAAEGMNVEEAVAKLRRFGLTFEEIEADAKSLADALKHVDDVNKSIDSGPLKDVADRTKNVRAETEDMTDSARGAHSALANMVGNSAQDLGELGGLAGSVGVGIGQMAEYAADAKLAGEGLGSVLGSMATVAGPIAAIAVSVAAVQGALDAAAAAGKRSQANIDAWRTAMDNGGDAAAEYTDHLRELGKVSLDVQREQSGLQNVTAKLSNTFGFASPGVEVFKNIIGASDDETKDLTETLAHAGVTVDQWTKLTMSGAQGVELLNTVLNQANITGGDHDDIITALIQGQSDYAAALESSALFTQFFGKETQTAGEIVSNAFDDAQAAVDKFRRQVEAEREAIQDNADDLRDNADAVYEMIDARRAAIDSTFAMQRANDEWSKTLTDTKAKAEELEKVIKDGSKTDSEKVAAYAELQDLYRKGAESAAQFADAEVRWAEDQAKASGATLTQTEKLDLWNRKMLAAAAAADGPLRESIVGMIAQYNDIPEEQVTDIVANADPNAIEDAAADLDAVSESRDSLVIADADTTLATTAIDSLNGREVTISATVLADALRTKIANALGPFAQFVIPKGAAKGMFVPGKPTLALIGETGDDEVVLNLDDPASMRPLLTMPGVMSRIFGALGQGTVAPMAEGGIVTRGQMGGGRSVELRGIDFGKALDTVFSGYTDMLQATDALTEAQQRLAKAVEEGGATLDANTEEGSANRDAVDAQWAAVRKLAEAQFDQGASVDQVTGFLRSNVDALRGQLEGLGMTSDAIDDYLARLGATPDAIEQVTRAIADQQRQAAAEDAAEKQVRVEDYLYERRKISADRYLILLRQRQAAEEKNSADWFALQRKIDAVEQDRADAEEQRLQDSQDRIKQWADAVVDAFERADDVAAKANDVAANMADVAAEVWQSGLGQGTGGRKAVLDQLNAIAAAGQAAVANGQSVDQAMAGVNANISALRSAVIQSGGDRLAFDALLASSGRSTTDFAGLLAASAAQKIEVSVPVEINGVTDPMAILRLIQQGVAAAAAQAAQQLRAA